MKKILFFDTETTGLPKNWKAPLTDTRNWPRMVQLAFQQFDTEKSMHAKANFIIKPDGYTIPPEAARVHRITTEKALAEGHNLQEILEEFHALLEESDILVAHNFEFDKNIIGAEFVRAKMTYTSLLLKDKICTMKDFLQPFQKWPKLEELHFNLFKTNFKEAHDASVDVDITVKCFWKLVEMGKVKF